jgi:hypothetical protein
MFGFGDSRYKEEARVTVETCISCARTMNFSIKIDNPELQIVWKMVPGFGSDFWVKLLALAQLEHNLMFIQRLIILGIFKTPSKDFLKTLTFVNEYIIAHPFFGMRFSELLIELINQTSLPQNEYTFPRYGWGRWIINLLKRENARQPLNLSEPLTFDEAKLADKIDEDITKTLMAQCDLLYLDCVKPLSLPGD